MQQFVSETFSYQQWWRIYCALQRDVQRHKGQAETVAELADIQECIRQRMIQAIRTSPTTPAGTP